MIEAVSCQPKRSWSGFMAQAMAGTKIKAPARLPTLAQAMAMARQIASNAPLAVQYFKELAYRGQNMSTQDISSLTYHMYDQLLTTEDSKEGPRAFAEKRKPQWKGR